MANQREIKTKITIDSKGVEPGAKAAGLSIRTSLERPLRDVQKAVSGVDTQIGKMWEKMVRGQVGNAGQSSYMKRGLKEVETQAKSTLREVERVVQTYQRGAGGQFVKMTPQQKSQLGQARIVAGAASREDAAWREYQQQNRGNVTELGRLRDAWNNANAAKHALETNVKGFIPVMAALGVQSKGVAKMLDADFVSALTKSGDAFNAVFNNTLNTKVNELIKALQRGEPATMGLTRAFDKAVIRGDIAVGRLGKDFDGLVLKMSKSITFQSFKDPLAAARQFLTVFRQTGDAAQSLKVVRDTAVKTEQEILALQVRQAEQMRVQALSARAGDATMSRARHGTLNPDIAAQSGSMQQAAQLVRNYLAALDPAAAAQQAFTTALAESIVAQKGDVQVGYAATVGRAAFANATKRLTTEAAKLAQQMSLDKVQTKVFLEGIRDGKNVMDALAAATGAVIVRFEQLNAAGASTRAMAASFERTGSMVQAIKKGLLEEEGAARLLNAQVDQLAKKFGISAQKASELAERIAAGATASEAVAATRSGGSSLSSLNAAKNAQAAFNLEYKRTNDIGRAVNAALNAESSTMKRVSTAATTMGSTVRGANLNLATLVKELAAGTPVLDAVARATVQATRSFKIFGMEFKFVGDAISRTNKMLENAGTAFASLYVFARIKQVLEGYLATLVDLAKTGAEFQTQQISLAVVVKHLGLQWSDAQGAIKAVTTNFIDQKTAAHDLMMLLQSGLGFDNAVKLMRTYEENALKMDLDVGGVAERVNAAVEGFYARQSRKVTNAIGLHITNAQAAKMNIKSIQEFLTQEEKVTVGAANFAKVHNMAGESAKLYAATMKVAQLQTGLLAAATNTTQGQIAIFDKQILDLKRDIGMQLAPVLGAILKFLTTGLIPAVQQWVLNNRNLVRELALLTAWVAIFGVAVSSVILTLGALAFALSLHPLVLFLAIIAAIVLALGALVVAVVGPKNALAGLIRGFATAYTFAKLVGLGLKTVSFDFQYLASFIGFAIDKVKEFFHIKPDLSGIAAGVAAKTKLIADLTAQITKTQVAIDALKNPTGAAAKQNPHLRGMAIAKLEHDKAELEFRKQLVGFGTDANNAMAAFNGLDKSIDEMVAGLAGLKKDKDPFPDFGQAADNSKKRVRDATAAITQGLLGLRGSLNSILDDLRGSVSEAFFDDGSFDRKLLTFNRKMDDAMKALKTKLASGDIGFGKMLEDLNEQVEAARKGEKQAFTEISTEQGIATKKAVELSKPLKAIRDEYNNITASLEKLKGVVKEVFAENLMNQELAKLKDFASLSKTTQKLVQDAEAQTIARSYAGRTEAFAAMLKAGLIDETQYQAIRTDLEKQANLEILRERSSLFRDIEEVANGLLDQLKDELKDFFGLFAMGTKAIRDQQLAVQVADRRLRAQELINQVNQTARTEKERQARILAIERDTATDIRLIQYEAAHQYESRWAKAAKNVAFTIRDTLIKAFVDNTLKKKLIDAVGSLFGSGAKALFEKQEIRVRLAEAIEQSLKNLADADFKDNWEKELASLKSIDTNINSITQFMLHGTEGADKSDPKYGKGGITGDRPDYVPTMFGPPSPFRQDAFGPGGPGSEGDQAKANAKMMDFQKGLVAAARVLGAIAGLYAVLGVKMPKALKEMLGVMAAVNLALEIHKTIMQLVNVLKTKEVALLIAHAAAIIVDIAQIIAHAALMAAKFIGGLFGFAKGGMVMKPTLAHFEGRSREAVLPLDNHTMGMLARSIVAAGGRDGLVGAAPASSRSGNGYEMHFHFAGMGSNSAVAGELQREVEKTVIRVMKKNTIGMGGVA